jgi:hypothetical protein
MYKLTHAYTLILHPHTTYAPLYVLCPVTGRAASVLRNETAVDAVELFDRASLRECEADEAMTRLVCTAAPSRIVSWLWCMCVHVHECATCVQASCVLLLFDRLVWVMEVC